MKSINNSWQNLLKSEFEKPYFKNLENFLKKERELYQIYPQQDNVFFALNCVPLNNVKVVIIGQDPYHQPNQAHGLAFSVKKGQPSPPSLKNIFKAIQMQLKITCFNDGNLTRWANQGVLLLNTVLTVRQSQPNSHKKHGWELFTSKILSLLNQSDSPIVFLLWGNNAKALKHILTNPKHLVLESVHPSPLSAHNGFFENNHFVTVNNFLKNCGRGEIDWR